MLFAALKNLLNLPDDVTYLSLTMEMDRPPELMINRIVNNVQIEEAFLVTLPKFELEKLENA